MTKLVVMFPLLLASVCVAPMARATAALRQPFTAASQDASAAASQDVAAPTQAAPQDSAPTNHTNDGPLASTGVRCYRGETRDGMEHCDCEVLCSGETLREQPWDAEHQSGCKNYCAPQRHPPACVCHADENACAPPQVQPAPHHQ